MQVMLNVTECNSPHAQSYMPESGGCWKNDGQPCDGDLTTDSTRCIGFIVNPGVFGHKSCKPTSQGSCLLYHIFTSGARVYRNDTENNSDAPTCEKCDPYSNPMSQELVQILPCSEWGAHGFPSKLGMGRGRSAMDVTSWRSYDSSVLHRLRTSRRTQVAKCRDWT